MRRELLWALAASAVLSAWALLNPGANSGSAGVVAAVEQAPSSFVKMPSAALAGRPPNAASPTSLPATWPTPAMESAARNPFASAAPPVYRPTVVAPVAPAPAPPAAPPITYRFWGSLTTPAGEHVIYVARDDNGQPVAVQVGTRLEGGYEVEQVSAAAVVLVQPESQRHVTLSLAPPPATGAR